MLNGITDVRFYDTSHRVRSKGKKTVQRTHCALEEREANVNVQVYEDVQVPLDALKVLSLPPKFALHPRIEMKSVELEVEKGIWKARWEHRSQQNREGRGEPNEQEMNEELAETRLWDNAEKELDYSKVNLPAREIAESGGVIRPTDKTGKHCVESIDSYAEKMKKHIKDDPVINEKGKEKCVRQCNGHSAFWRRIVSLCSAHPAEDALGDRVTSALTQDQCMLPPPLIGNTKDHKDEANPDVRPICQAKCAPNNILSWILAKVVGKVGEEAPESQAVYSTEEIQAKIVRLNTELRDERREIGVGSMDVVGLYPALQKDWVKKILMIMMMKTEVKVAGVDWKELGM